MTASSRAESLASLERFCALIVRRFGLNFDPSRHAALAETLVGLAGAEGVASYLSRLEQSTLSREEIRVLTSALTVGETYFFRHFEQIQAFSHAAMPSRLSARATARQLRILSAGCASGEEPYTLAMIVKDMALGPDWDVSIRAIDLNTDSLKRARRGRYTAWSLRETPAQARRWFHQEHREFVLDPSILAMVSFEERNLSSEEPDLWTPQTYDIVFCRNVLMYFTPDILRRAIERISRSMVPGGFLFLGHAETLRGVSQDFHLRHTHGTFYYERKSTSHSAGRFDVALEPKEPGKKSEPRDAIEGTEPAASAALVSQGAVDWVENVRRSVERVEALIPDSSSSSPLPPLSSAAVSPPPGLVQADPAVFSVDRGPVLALIQQERFAEAQACLTELSRGAPEDAWGHLLRAVLLTHLGPISEAERVCKELLDHEEHRADALYLLGLCREHVGDKASAQEKYLLSTQVDPTFAMPRLHLGLLARRAGERLIAQRELEQAARLLTREEPTRVLLFGGGFGRDGLITLCRAERLALGGHRDSRG